MSRFLNVVLIAGSLAALPVQAINLADPMRPAGKTLRVVADTKKAPTADVAPAPEPLELSAIRFEEIESARSAIINGHWVHAGSTVDSARVLRIERLSVELERGGKLITLELVPRLKKSREG